MVKADIVFKNGNVITISHTQPRAQAVAIWEDRILAVGDNLRVEPLIGPKTKVVNLAGKTLMPGFNDAHNHMLMYGTGLMEVDCSSPPVGSIADIKKLIAEQTPKTPAGEWIRAWGYDDSKLAEKRMPNRWDLDEISPAHPVSITRTCVHMIVVNSRALELVGITRDTPDPEGGKIVRDPATGEPTGLLQESAQNLVKDIIPPYGQNDLRQAIKLASQKYVSQGITSSSDASTLVRIKDEMPAWYEAKQNGDLLVRTYLMMGEEIAAKVKALGLKTGFGDNMLRLGSIKMFSDGGVGGATAALSESYSHQPGSRGILYMSQEEIDQKIADAHNAGFQISIHAIGDRAIEMVVAAYAKALPANPRINHRHRIEHCQVCPAGLQRKIADLGIIPVMQPSFFYRLGDSHIVNLGRTRVAYEFPVRSILALGAKVAGSSDRPVVDGNPIFGLYTAVTRRTDSGDNVGTEECISIEKALEMYTLNGAYASFEENIKGSIEQGKLADMIILSADPTQIDPEELLNLHVEMTMVGGKVVFGGLD